MRSCFDIAAAGSAKSKFGSFSALILHKIQKNGVKDQFEGYMLNDEGKLERCKQAKTISEAEAAADNLRRKLIN
jgi:hypothetical protein